MLQHLIDFLDLRGFYKFKMGFVPYMYNDGHIKLLSMHSGYEFTKEQLAVSGWSMPVFNHLLALASKSTNLLLRLDRCPFGFEGELCSHVIAANYDHLRYCFWLQDTDTQPVPLLQDKEEMQQEWIQMAPAVSVLLSDCFRLTVYDFQAPATQKQMTTTEEGVF